MPTEGKDLLPHDQGKLNGSELPSKLSPQRRRLLDKEVDTKFVKFDEATRTKLKRFALYTWAHPIPEEMDDFSMAFDILADRVIGEIETSSGG